MKQVRILYGVRGDGEEVVRLSIGDSESGLAFAVEMRPEEALVVAKALAEAIASGAADDDDTDIDPELD